MRREEQGEERQDEPNEELEAARWRVDRFVRQFGEDYRGLVRVAAVPIVLTPELVGYLRGQFLPGLVWVAEADLLLSELCRPVGYERYVMDSDVQAIALQELEAGEPERVEEIARLLVGYMRHLARVNPYLTARQRKHQQWAAMLCVAELRGEAIDQMGAEFEAYSGAIAEPGGFGAGRSELLWLAGIVRDLAPRLGEHEALVRLAVRISEAVREPVRVDRSVLAERFVVGDRELRVPVELLGDVQRGFPPLQEFEFETVEIESQDIQYQIQVDKEERRVVVSNPFEATGPIEISTIFWWRGALLRRIFERIEKGQSLALIGPSGMGKSFILQVICREGPERLKRSVDSFITIDMSLVREESMFFELLCDELDIKNDHPLQIQRQLRKRNQRYVLCLDNIDSISNAEFFPESTRNWLRGIADMSDSPLQLVVASRRELHELFPDSPQRTSPLANILVSLRVNALTREEATEFVNHALQGTGVSFSDGQLDEIWTASQGNLYELKLLAARLFDVQRNMPQSAVEIEDKILHRADVLALEWRNQRFEFETARFNLRLKGFSRRQPAIQIMKGKGQAEGYLEQISDEVSLKMIAIPAGRFQMGAPKGELESRSRERPQHWVMVSEFWLGQEPVTQSQWRAVAELPQVKIGMKVAPSQFKGSQLPVERVSWGEAVEFCDRLSALTGRTYRLPSEAMWEYACRAGTTTPFSFGETIDAALANYNSVPIYGKGKSAKPRSKTTPIGQFPANDFGLYDMHGNVYEWCEDHWHGDYKGAPSDGSSWLEKGLNRGLARVVRGGSWFGYPWGGRSAFRDYSDAGSRYNYLGFRVCVVR
jgi:formylglycine-generating enzyme required for sulfatase activity/type II secretory pathway predicted ATPase ExeA